jgi:hypothetical protein
VHRRRAVEPGLSGGDAGGVGLFLVVWIADSDRPIMAESVRRLNSAAVAREFIREFG